LDIRFLDLLCDPATKEPLKLEIIERFDNTIVTGFLFSSTNKYPIIRGVPRFNLNEISEEYTMNFGYQWNKWPYVQFEEENLGKPMSGHTLQMFKRITEISLTESDEKEELFCDIGCGSGRFIDLISKTSNYAIGIDSSEAVESAARKFSANPRILICQADVLQLPIVSDVVDHVYSIGVLHHTADPLQATKEIGRVLKSNGSASIAVYGKGGYYDDQIVRAYRTFFSKTWPVFGHHLPLIYSRAIIVATRPLEKFKRLKILLKPILMYFPHIQLPDIKWSILDTFDSITPSYQRGITPFELHSYMVESGIDDIKPVNWGGTSLKGKRA